MSDPSSDHDDLRALWQGQPKETDPMSLEHIQAISRRLDRNELRSALLMLVVAAMAFFAVGLGWQKFPDPMIRATFALYGLGVAGCFTMAYRMIHLARDPTEPGGVFLRRRLEHFLRLSGGRGLVIVLPLVPWLVATVVVGFLKHGHARPPPHMSGAHQVANWAPIALLAAAWLFMLLVYRPRQVRRLRRDLDELDAAMK